MKYTIEVPHEIALTVVVALLHYASSLRQAGAPAAHVEAMYELASSLEDAGTLEAWRWHSRVVAKGLASPALPAGFVYRRY